VICRKSSVLKEHPGRPSVGTGIKKKYEDVKKGAADQSICEHVTFR
jgi:hypothetical protein